MSDAAAPNPLGSGSARLPRRLSAPERHLTSWIALWTVAVLGGLGSVAQFVLEREDPVEPVQVVFRLVGFSFAASGLVAWRRRPDSHSGRLLTATGFALYVTPLLSLVDTPVAQTLALLFPDLWVLPFVALVLTFPTGGRLRTTLDRVLVGAVAVELVVLAPLYLVFAESEGALRFLPHAGAAEVIDTAQKALFLVVCPTTAAVVAARFGAASPPGRRAMAPSVAGAACLLAFGALLAVDLLGGGRPTVLLWTAACMLVTVPLAFLAGLLRSRLARAGVADLFRELRTMRPDELRAALANALGDPALVIAYARADGSFADADDRPVTLPGPGRDRSVVLCRRDGEPVAALVHDPSLDDDPELLDAAGAAAAIALENRQLHADAEARRRELDASRERIITAADAERRRIERNLHDGAQQRLVTLSLQLSLIRRRISRDPAGAELLAARAGDELARSLEELRELARGIHPAVLDQGLEPALEALALRSAVPTLVTCAPGGRLPRPVEFAAYFVASEALTNVAKYARATAATVRVRREGAALVVEVADDGVGGADPAAGTGLRGLDDRVEALHGRLRVDSPSGGGTVVSAEIPVPAAATGD